ncbi:MAG: response regulator transcription factor [Acidimicrobiales bacterium]
MPEANVLVVDDDLSLVRVLVVGFEARDYAVRTATTGRAALEEGMLTDVDVVVLDLGLPDIDGLEVCRHMRLRTPIPIIVLSADGAEDRKVAALDMGADDYLTKPFSMPELLARVRVGIRHRRVLGSLVDDELLQVGLLRIDLSSREAMVVDQPLDLTPKEFALLTLLARNAGRVLTHRAILDQVWGPGQALDTLRTHVSQLRRKLAELPGAPVLMTAPGVGYRLLDEPTTEVDGVAIGLSEG